MRCHASPDALRAHGWFALGLGVLLVLPGPAFAQGTVGSLDTPAQQSSSTAGLARPASMDFHSRPEWQRARSVKRTGAVMSITGGVLLLLGGGIFWAVNVTTPSGCPPHDLLGCGMQRMPGYIAAISIAGVGGISLLAGLSTFFAGMGMMHNIEKPGRLATWPAPLDGAAGLSLRF